VSDDRGQMTGTPDPISSPPGRAAVHSETRLQAARPREGATGLRPVPCSLTCKTPRGGFAGLVATARGKHPVPSRTRPLSPAAPMVLRPKTRESRSPPDLDPNCGQAHPAPGRASVLSLHPPTRAHHDAPDGPGRTRSGARRRRTGTAPLTPPSAAADTNSLPRTGRQTLTRGGAAR
jgi:hypothetical protein